MAAVLETLKNLLQTVGEINLLPINRESCKYHIHMYIIGRVTNNNLKDTIIKADSCSASSSSSLLTLFPIAATYVLFINLFRLWREREMKNL